MSKEVKDDLEEGEIPEDPSESRKEKILQIIVTPSSPCIKLT